MSNNPYQESFVCPECKYGSTQFHSRDCMGTGKFILSLRTRIEELEGKWHDAEHRTQEYKQAAESYEGLYVKVKQENATLRDAVGIMTKYAGWDQSLNNEEFGAVYSIVEELRRAGVKEGKDGK